MRLQQPPREDWLLVSRHPVKPDQLACYVVFGPADTILTMLARVAGRDLPSETALPWQAA
jgi:hypothetical protein